MASSIASLRLKIGPPPGPPVDADAKAALVPDVEAKGALVVPARASKTVASLETSGPSRRLALPHGQESFESHAEVGRSRAHCFNQLIRVEELPRVLAGVASVTKLGGSRATWAWNEGIERRTQTVAFTPMVDDSTFGWTSIDGPRNEARFVLEALGVDRTGITFTAAADSPGLGTHDRVTAQRKIGDDLQRLKRLVEGKTQKRHDVPRRVDLDGRMVGLSAPPCDVTLKFLPLHGAWSVIALTAPGRPPAIARWLEAYGPKSVQISSGLSPKMLRATFDPLPPAWERLVLAVRVRFVSLTKDGTASLFISGPPYHGERFVKTQQLLDPNIRARALNPGIEHVKLPPRQAEILSLAVALGYYELPHSLNLRALAEKLNLSLGTVAEALRRAEAQILTSYVDSMAEALWPTLLDDNGADPAEKTRVVDP